MPIFRYSNSKFTVSSGTTYGDTSGSFGTGSTGGADKFIGASQVAAGYTAIGDASQIIGKGIGGDDVFTGGSNCGTLDTRLEFIGDANAMHDYAVGGKDSMTVGTDSACLLVGDALDASTTGLVQGGADTMVGSSALSGLADTLMYGDFITQSGHVVGGADRLTGGGASTADGSLTAIIFIYCDFATLTA